MSRRPDDRELDRLLANLPRETASPGFSRRVLEQLDAPARARGRRPWLAVVVAAAAAAILALGLWLLPRPAPEPSLVETRALREEHRQLMAELEALKASLRQSETAPVLYLGGNESVDLVLDLRPVWSGEAGLDARRAVYDAGQSPVAASDRRGGDRR